MMNSFLNLLQDRGKKSAGARTSLLSGDRPRTAVPYGGTGEKKLIAKNHFGKRAPGHLELIGICYGRERKPITTGGNADEQW